MYCSWLLLERYICIFTNMLPRFAQPYTNMNNSVNKSNKRGLDLRFRIVIKRVKCTLFVTYLNQKVFIMLFDVNNCKWLVKSIILILIRTNQHSFVRSCECTSGSFFVLLSELFAQNKSSAHMHWQK